MAATVLNSAKAVEISLYAVRAFLQLRTLLSSNRELAGKLELLERKFAGHDQAIAEIIEIVRRLVNPPLSASKRSIGFVPLEERK